MNIGVEVCREFIVLAEQLNFTRAAQRMQMTQPQLSKHIAHLEKDLGAQLVRRGGSSLTLTPAGVAFLEGCIAIVATYEATLADVRAATSHPVYSLRLAGPFMFDSVRDFVSAAIARGRKEQAFDVSFVAETPLPYLEMLRAGKVDLALEIMSEKLVAADLESVIVSRDPMCIATRDPRYAREYGSEIPFAALNGAIIHSLDGLVHSRGRERFFELCARHGIQVRPHVMRADPFSLRLEEIGDEVVILSEGVKDHYPLPGMNVHSIQELDCYFELAAFWKADSRNPAVPLLVRHLREAGETGRVGG
ncbi:MAG: LysR family transcriptional regulator [Coriobacteriia bacterium]